MSSKPKISILGAAESGIGAAILAHKKGYDVFVSDNGKINLNSIKLLEKYNISWEEGRHSIEDILSSNEVVKSPGIPEKTPIMQALRKSDILISSEIEFASRYTKAMLIAITGSNGKTTTTSMVYSMLKNAGFNVGLAGNIGKSFAYQVAMYNFNYYVLEVSSFQLDDIHTFAPHIAVITNITPDHLDRYNYSLDEYANSKFKITRNQTPKDYLVFCLDDLITMGQMQNYSISAKKLPFTIKKIVEEGADIENENLTFKINKTNSTMSIYKLGVKGKHNVYNSLASGIVARALDIKKETIRESLMDFKDLEHRMESVLKIGGKEFVNDSKATNVNSTWYALESINKPIVWIAGGIDKGNDYKVLQPLIREKVHTVICLGKDNRNLHEAFSHYTDLMINVLQMNEAVQVANHFSNKGDIILLSPACASFDLFENYEDRGNQFKKAVRSL